VSGEDVSLAIGTKIVTVFPLTKMCRAFVTLMAIHYVMDIDYCPQYEIALTIFQFLIYQDKKTPKDLVTQVDTVWREFCDYKHGRS